MTDTIERHTWVNTLVGMLDGAFSLTEEELFIVSSKVRDLLDKLNIPERGRPVEIANAVALEASSQLYSTNILDPRDHGYHRRPREVADRDAPVTLEAWRQALLGLILVSYPDLDGVEVVAATKVFDELLLGLGVPDRGAAFVPDDVVRAHLQGA